MRRRAAKTSRARTLGVSADPTPINSTFTPPLSSTYSSAYPSAYPSEAEFDPEADDAVANIPIASLSLGDATTAGVKKSSRRVKEKPFRLLDLPVELRIKIYDFHFGDNGVVDLDPDNHKRLYKKLFLLRTCRTVYGEASHFFYSTRTFRVFPTCPGRFLKTKKPLLSRLRPHQRASITCLELRLGPSWGQPPRGWVVNDALGLPECVNLRRMCVFVECDPSDNIFNGFRKADGFYEGFSRNLLGEVLTEVPFLDRVEFDAWPSVKKTGAMMRGLLDIARAHERLICWGPERGWADQDADDDRKSLPRIASMLPSWSSPGVVVLA